MTKYQVHLKSTDTPVIVEAEKFICEPGYTVFYARPAPKEPFEETLRFASTNVKDITQGDLCQSI